MSDYEREKVYRRKLNHRDRKHKSRSALVKEFSITRKGHGKLIYPQYIRSKEWQERCRIFYGKYGRRCAICGTGKEVRMHHMSYLHLGNEKDNELMPLCTHHHHDYHRLNGTQGNMIKKTHVYVQAKKEELARKAAKKEIVGAVQTDNS